MHRDLPLEIWDMALDSLWDNQSALSACSLVCRAWLPSARLHKFRIASIRTPERCRWLESFLDSPTTGCATIPLYVRELRLGPDPKDATYDGSIVGSIWDDPQLVRLLRNFSRVKKLRLYNLEWTPYTFPPERACLFTAAFPRLKKLAMRVAVFRCTEDLLLLLSSFPRLSSVTMAFVSWCDQNIVTLWTTAPHRPSKRSAQPILLFLNKLRTDSTSYVALMTAASVSQNTWRIELDELEWVGHEKFANDWMLAQAFEQNSAFINPLSDIIVHLFTVDGHGILETQPSPLSRLDTLHVDMTTMPGRRAWTSVRIVPFSSLDIRIIRYTIGTIRACRAFTELHDRIAWKSLDRDLTGLLADHPQLLSKFYVDIDSNGETVDCAECMAVVEDSFNQNIPRLLKSGARVSATITYPTGNSIDSKVHQELWWPKPSVSGASDSTNL